MDKIKVEEPIITIDKFIDDAPRLTLHNYISLKGKMVINKSEACLLLIELQKFINS